MPNKKIINHGVLFRPLTPSDFILGASAITYEQRVMDFNWTKWLPEDEKQKIGFETSCCVSFAACNVIETQLNWLYDVRKIPQAAVDFLMDNGYYKNGKFNVSDRFIAILSDTTANGNYLDKVDYTIRKVGLIPESMLPFGGTNQTEYLNPVMVTKEMTDLGLKFLEYFNIQYEALFYPGMMITTSDELKGMMQIQLRQAPLHIATATCNEWGNQSGVIPICLREMNHSTQLTGLVWEQYFMDYDTYIPFQKKLAWDYQIPCIFKLLINPVIQNQEAIDKAKLKIKEIMKGRPSAYFFRPNANGEAYLSNFDGSFKYKKGLPCPLFTSMCEDKTITPIGEDIWKQIELAEIK